MKIAKMPSPMSETQSTLVPSLVTLTIVFTLVIAETYMYPSPPVITSFTSGHIYPNKGSGSTLHCHAKGDPDGFSKSWYKNGNMLKDKENESEITVYGNGSGEYWCTVSNKYGKAMSDKAIVVNPVLSFPRSSRNKHIDLKVGSSHMFKIDTEAIKAIPADKMKIRWTLNKERYIQTEDGFLYITKVTEDDDGNKIKCVIDNHLLKQLVTCATYTIHTIAADPDDDKVPPKCTQPAKQLTYIVGNDVKLTCSCNGPLQWHSDRPSFEMVHGHVLELKNVTLEDSANYTCSASNDYGSDSIKFNLNIQSKVEVTEAPKNVIAGPFEKEAQFYCKGKGDPSPTAEWYINGEKVTDISSMVSYKPTIGEGVLTVKDLTVNTAMTIQCNLSNPNSYHWLQSTLVVSEKLNTKDSSTTTTTETTPMKVTTLTSSTTSTTATTTTEKATTRTTKSSSIIISTLLSTTTKAQQSQIHTRVSSSSPVVKDLLGSTDKTFNADTEVQFSLPIKNIMIGAGVFVFVLILGAVICTCLCMKWCQKRKEEAKSRQYPRSNTLSNLSYISHLARMRDFDGESEDSGIDERSVLKGKINSPRNESQENYKNEFDEMNVDPEERQPTIMEHHL